MFYILHFSLFLNRLKSPHEADDCIYTFSFSYELIIYYIRSLISSLEIYMCIALLIFLSGASFTTLVGKLVIINHYVY